jgi:mutator protein MutT
MGQSLIKVVAGIIQQNNKIMCARRRSGKHLAGYWEFPGGKVNASEPYEAALVRELEEELSITVQVGPHIGQSTYNYGGKSIQLHAYLCPKYKGAISLDSHDAICWLSLDELITLEWAPADIPLISQLKTFLYYENAAKKYANETAQFDMDAAYIPFLNAIKPNGYILDLGCGSARDALAFKKLGYRVCAADACPSVANIAKDFLGEPVLVMNCFQMAYKNTFDGIWACASLLHSPKQELTYALEKIIEALNPGGIAFLSFKEGTGEGEDNLGRFFSYYQPQELRDILDNFDGIKYINFWQEEKDLRGIKQIWINILFCKDESHD